MKKVDLVVYKGGFRKVIGEAVVDIDSDYISVEGKITDKEYAAFLTDHQSAFSIGPFKAGTEPSNAN